MVHMRKNYSFIVDLADMLAEEITETFKYSPDLKKHKFYKDLVELSNLQKKLSDMNESFSMLSLEQLAYVSNYLLSKFEFHRIGVMESIINVEHPKYTLLCIYIGCLIVYRMNELTQHKADYLVAMVSGEVVH